MPYFIICCNNFLFIVLTPNQHWVIEMMRKLPLEDYNQLAEITLSLENWAETNKLVANEVMNLRTHAYAYTKEYIIKYYSDLEKKHDTVWYRSSETILSENPHTNWLSKKKWPLNEQLNLHMLNYQEVIIIIIILMII